MIKFNCDKCDMEIELEDHLAGTKYECLNCGDINRVPSPMGSDPTPFDHDEAVDSKHIDKAAKAGFPPDQGPEVRVLKVRRCWFRSRVIRFSLTVLIGLLSLIGLIWVPVTDQSIWWVALFAPLLLLSVGLLSWWWIDRLSASLEITTKRTVMLKGFFSKSSSEVVHDNIRNIQIDQTFMQRVMKVGRIGISSSGQDGIELQVNHLKDPEYLRQVIDLYRPL
ncbi:MAG: PH domain-containing protein [Phycisphaerales bacterium JB052]